MTKNQITNLSDTDLAALIQELNVAYFEGNKPLESDETYDLLVQEQKRRDPNHPLLHQVGSGAKGLHKHDKPMLSLNKAYTEDDVHDWAKKIKGNICATLKLDGLALSIKYKNGQLSRAVTRGDGEYGEDVTDAVTQMTSVPKKIPVSRDLEVRGEAYLSFRNFEWISKNLDGKFENTRNVASGALKSKKVTGNRTDYSEQTKKVLSLMTFEAYDVAETKLDSYAQTLLNLTKAGFVTPNSVFGLDTIFELWHEVNDNREKFDKPVDGIVLRADSYVEFEEHGYTSHHPRGALAYKFSAEIKETILLGIEWSLGRTGKITPVGLVEPTRFPVSGVTVSRVTLHNVGIIKKLGLTEGCTIKLQRSGDVIPMVLCVTKPGTNEFVIPVKCPLCSSTTIMEGDFVLCTGLECKGSAVRAVEHFCKTVGIDGFGPAIIEQLYDAGQLKKFANLYKLNLEDMKGVLGEKTASNLLTQINKAKSIPLAKFIDGLGIPKLGTSMGKKLENVFDAKSPSALMDLPAVIDKFGHQIDGLGDVIRKQVDESLPKLHSDLLSLDGIVTLTKEDKKTGKLTGQSFVFTGTLTKMGRTAAQKLVNDLGGETPASVKAGLTYLICGGDEGKSSKQVKAEKLGVKCITEDEFLKLVA